MRRFFRNVPLYFYIVIAYAIIVGLYGVIGGGGDFNWNQKIFDLPLFGSTEPVETIVEVPAACTDICPAQDAVNGLRITPLALLVVFAFLAQWLEAIRATQVSGTARNDIWSVILLIVTLVLFVGVPQFQTFAFFVVVIVAFGDVLLDRIIGQAVARRDFGGDNPFDGS